MIRNVLRKRRRISSLSGVFSDNNSCIRRDIFEKYPYEDINFAEDQIWARKMIELGFKKVYCLVCTGISFPQFQTQNVYFKRYYDEQKGLYEVHRYMIAQKWTQLRACCTRQGEEGTACISVSRSVKRENPLGILFPVSQFLTALWAAISAKYHLIPNETTVPGSSRLRSSTIRDMHRRNEKET